MSYLPTNLLTDRKINEIVLEAKYFPEISTINKKGSEKRRQSLTKPSNKELTRSTCTDAVINRQGSHDLNAGSVYTEPFAGFGHMSVSLCLQWVGKQALQRKRL